MRALILEYLAHELFELPIHHILIFNRIRSFYQNFQNADIYMKDLDLPEVLEDLEKMYSKIHIASASRLPPVLSEPN
jgi:hypothetical protein